MTMSIEDGPLRRPQALIYHDGKVAGMKEMKQRCMAAVCEKCAEGVPAKKLSEGWYHVAGNECKAQPIRELER